MEFILNSAEARFAVQAVRTAAGLCRQIQRELVDAAISKSDRSPVTVADFSSQAVIAALLRETFPDAVLVAEEDSAILRDPASRDVLTTVTDYVRTERPGATAEQVCELIDIGRGRTGERFWTLDPIDGTKGFLRGDQYVVALALIESWRVVLSAMACPHLDPDLKPAVGGEGSVTLAVRDQGAWATTMAGDHWTGLHVSTQSDPARARILRSFESAHTDSRRVEDLTAALGTQAAPALMDSAAKYATLAAGHGELLFRLLSPHKPDYEEKIWDQAAGALLVQEAGGRVTDLRGADLDFGQGRTLRANVGVLASNGALHNAALDALRMTERR